MIKLILKAFVPNHQDTNDKQVREAYGVVGGIVGILCNFLLFLVKLIVGLTINSIAVISDAFNNLTDMGSSFIAIVGAKMSNRPPDPEHPFGHGRIEYISSLAVSFIIFFVGWELLKSSIEKILHPEPVIFDPLMMAILLLSVLVKVWMFSYNRYIAKAIKSSINKATAYDSINDAAATTAVIAATAAGYYWGIALDGIIGLLISLLILYSGAAVAKETIDLLLGSQPDPELVEAIESIVLKRPPIVGVHDLIVHDYGPGRVIASIHAEVPDEASIVEVHNVIDAIEKQALEELGINLVIHMDPLSVYLEKNKASQG